MKERDNIVLEQLKHFGLKKNVAITEKKKNNISEKLYTPTKGIFLHKLPLILTLQMN